MQVHGTFSTSIFRISHQLNFLILPVQGVICPSQRWLDGSVAKPLDLKHQFVSCDITIMWKLPYFTKRLSLIATFLNVTNFTLSAYWVLSMLTSNDLWSQYVSFDITIIWRSLPYCTYIPALISTGLFTFDWDSFYVQAQHFLNEHTCDSQHFTVIGHGQHSSDWATSTHFIEPRVRDDVAQVLESLRTKVSLMTTGLRTG